MQPLKVILFSCFVQIGIFVRSTQSQYVGFNVGFGSYYGNTPAHGSGRPTDGYADVAQDLKMGQNCQIGLMCKIGSGCSLGDNVRLSNNVQMDQGVSVGSNCQIMEYANIGAHVNVGSNSLMNAYAQINENANIGGGCIMGMHANVGSNARLEQNVYAGDYGQIGSNAVIGANSVIQSYAVIPDNGYVGPNEMVIKTPTTSQLYQNSLPINQIPQSDVDLADQGQPENLNERVSQLMSTQKQNMESNCQRNEQSVDFKPLSLAVSLYLIRCDGLDQFTQNMGQDNEAHGVFSLGNFGIGIGEFHFNGGGQVFGSGQSGGNVKHFVEGSPHKFLQSELENNMVEMLALKEDSQRANRAPGDTFCQTVSKVQNKQTKVKCDEAVGVGNPNQNGHPSPNQGGQNNNSPTNNPPSSGGQIGYEQSPTYQVTQLVNPNSNNNRRPAQETNQPTPNYPSNSYAPNNPTPNTREPNRRPNPNPPPSTSHNNQPNRPQNGHPDGLPTQPNGGFSPNCNQCNIQSDTNFGHNIEFGNNLSIGKGTTIGNNCQIRDSVNVGDGVLIGSDSVVAENANIGDNCVLDEHSNVGPNANIGQGSYVGKNCVVGANAFVGENAIVFDNAKVPDGGHIGQNDVVIATPTSADLYSSCAPIETVAQNLISQPDPNKNLRQLMRGQIAKVRSHCQQPHNQPLLDFAALASAKTMYLISLHGIPGFTENLQNVLNKASGNHDSRAYAKLTNEEHFVENGQPSRVQPDVKGEMIILMAIEQDFGRANRSPGDSFCQTFMDIAIKQREVKCDK